MMVGQNFFDQHVKNDLKTYDNVQKIALCQVDDYTTGCLLDLNISQGTVRTFFMKTKFTILKFISFHFEAPNKQMMVYFQIKTGENFNLAKLFWNVRVRL